MLKVGYIGLGLMGKSIARNILKAGFPVVVHNRSRGAVEELVAEGSTSANSPSEVAEQVDVVFVDKAGEDKSVPLPALFDPVGHKHPSIHHVVAIESHDARDRCDPNQSNSQRKFHGLFLSVNQIVGNSP